MKAARMKKGGHAVSVGIFAILAAALLSACGGGGGGGGGGAPPGGQIPPPGGGPRPVASAISSGLFLGQGSVIVNGVQFSRDPGVAADNSVFINDVADPGGDAALRVGMVVKVRGSFGPTTLTGSYRSVEVEPQVIGLLANPTASGFTVLGQSVTVTPFTIFEGVSNPPAGAVEVHGSFTGPNAIEATFIRQSAVATVQLRGIVDSVIGTTLSIGSQQVGFSGVTPLPVVAAGDFVEVEGTVVGGAIQAAKVEVENLAAEAAERETEIEGHVEAAPGIGATFRLLTASGPITVGFGAGTVFEYEDDDVSLTLPSAAQVLTTGAHVEVEGIMGANGVLAATEIELEFEENVVLEGTFSDAGGINTIQPFGIAFNPGPGVTLPANGTHVEVGGFLAPGGGITATRVFATAPARSLDQVLQGPVTNVNLIDNTFSILGIRIDLTGLQERDDPVLGLTSEFENAANIRIQGRGDWMLLLQESITVVKAKAREDVLSPPFVPGSPPVFHPRRGVEIEEHR